MIRVVLPAHLKTLAGVDGELELDVADPVTTEAVIGALEARFPALGGTIRDRATGRRRPFIRFFAGEDDLSHDPADALLPSAVTEGKEAFCIVGAMAGG